MHSFACFFLSSLRPLPVCVFRQSVFKNPTGIETLCKDYLFKEAITNNSQIYKHNCINNTEYYAVVMIILISDHFVIYLFGKQRGQFVLCSSVFRQNINDLASC